MAAARAGSASSSAASAATDVKRPRKARPSVAPQPVAAVFEPLFSWLKLDEVARSYRVLRAFARAAGPVIGAQARAERVRGAILFVRVSSSAWSQELGMLRGQLLEKLRCTPGGQGIEEL